MHVPARIDAQTRRVLRTFGSRAHQLRPDNDERCEPELRPELQNRLCNLSDRSIFYIPGSVTIRPVRYVVDSDITTYKLP